MSVARYIDHSYTEDIQTRISTSLSPFCSSALKYSAHVISPELKFSAEIFQA